MTPRLQRTLASLALLGLSLASMAAVPAGTELEVPDGYTVPLSTYEITRAVTYPLSTYVIYDAEVPTSPTDELLELFDAEESPDGTVLKVPDRVLFDFGEATLRSSAADRLERLLVLSADAEGTIRVIGHTDSIGSAEFNQRLSEERAQAVADHLVANGVDADRIETEGRGETEPVEPNELEDGSDNPGGRQDNRRVEIIVHLD
jgi:outer membrane protein OmpA-like peptidoglycan-associated protein